MKNTYRLDSFRNTIIEMISDKQKTANTSKKDEIEKLKLTRSKYVGSQFCLVQEQYMTGLNGK